MVQKEIVIKRNTDHGVVTSYISRYGRFNWWADYRVEGRTYGNLDPQSIPNYKTDTYSGNRLFAFARRKFDEITIKRDLRQLKRRMASRGR